jgi:hypothetical protein
LSGKRFGSLKITSYIQTDLFCSRERRYTMEIQIITPADASSALNWLRLDDDLSSENELDFFPIACCDYCFYAQDSEPILKAETETCEAY